MATQQPTEAIDSEAWIAKGDGGENNELCFIQWCTRFMNK
jgi:hypothetical protein